MRKIFYIIIFYLIIINYQSTIAQQITYNWTNEFGSIKSDLATALVIDKERNNYICGAFSDSVDFGGITLKSAGKEDIFVAKYDEFGALLWVKRAGGGYNDRANCITLDSNNNIYVTGFYQSSAQFDDTQLDAHGTIFVAKYSNNGNLLWAKQINGNASNSGEKIICDKDFNYYVSGNFRGKLDFGDTTLKSNGLQDIFLVKYSNSSQLLWAKKMGSKSNDENIDLFSYNADTIYVSGLFKNALLIENDSIHTDLENDLFIAKCTNTGVYKGVTKLNTENNQISNRLQVLRNGTTFYGGSLEHVTDNNGVTETNKNIINSRNTGEGLQISLLNYQNTNCTTANDGSITINATSNLPLLKYSIDSARTFVANNIFTNLQHGYYQTVVTDNYDTLWGPRVKITYDIPKVQLLGLEDFYCNNDTPDTLVGLPAGGIFAGNGIKGNIFYPTHVTVGITSISYTYRAENNCQASDSSKTIILPVPEVTFTKYNKLYNNQQINLDIETANNLLIWNDLQDSCTTLIEGNQLGVGTHYYYFAANDSLGCTQQDTILVVVDDSLEMGKFNLYQLYPNPSRNIIYLELKNPDNKPLLIEIFTINGEKIFLRELNNYNPLSTETINVSNFYEGIYVLKMTKENTTQITKFIVLKK